MGDEPLSVVAGGSNDAVLRDFIIASTEAPERATAGRVLMGRSFRGTLYSYSLVILSDYGAFGISVTSDRVTCWRAPLA